MSTNNNIWVRRTPTEYGNYIDEYGEHYIIEWCHTLLTPDGSTPEQNGYELHASVDAAAAAWGLSWPTEEESATIDIATTEEESLTNNNDND